MEHYNFLFPNPPGPATPKSALQKIYREALSDSGLRFRVVERAGRTVKNFLQRSNPFRMSTCGKEDCFVCSTGEKGSCRAMGITYDIVCVPCSDMLSPGRYRYIWETARNAYTRGR